MWLCHLTPVLSGEAVPLEEGSLGPLCTLAFWLVGDAAFAPRCVTGPTEGALGIWPRKRLRQ